MRPLIRSKKGLATVVTTLIILVVAVLLASVVTFYAINVVTTRVQEESLQIYKQHIWHNGTNFAEAVFLLVNTGGRDVVVDKISVRGQESPWTNVYYNKTTDTISPDLYYLAPNANGTLLGKSVTLGSRNYTLTRTSDDLILRSGWSMIAYITNPDSISVNDIGITVGFAVFTANAQWNKETNVGAAT
jgi:FlaG/FlaF family flagellin (archaellin)